jgi:hypothetical protein
MTEFYKKDRMNSYSFDDDAHPQQAGGRARNFTTPTEP